MPLIACPDRDTLQNLLLGKLPAGERDALSEHLLHCEHCVALAETISSSDSLTAALRKRRVFPAPDEKLAEVIEKAKRIQPPQETLPEGACFGEDTAIPPGSADSTVQVPDLAFLHPAQEPEEMGRLGGYRVLDVLGAGGMGIVFLAEDARLRRLVALKAMKPAIAQDKAAKDRFLREAQTTAAIEHDHIVSIYQVGEDRGVPFIAMRYLRGESLKTRVEREGQLDQREVLRIGREIASGLAVAHAQGLIHRDIKPDNIWLEENQGRVKILDFGLVRAVTSAAELTQSGFIMGTPKYMAPEQAEGQAVDSRCDLFSLGCVLYHLAAGKAPFEAPSMTATLMAVAHHAPAPIQSLRPELSPDLARLIMELLAKKREARPQSALEVVERIRRIEEQLDQETTVAFVPTLPANRFPGGRKTSLAIATLAGCVILFGVILIIRDRDGKEVARVTVPDDANIQLIPSPEKPEPLSTPEKESAVPKPSKVAASQIPAIQTTDPISSFALVSRPAKLGYPDVMSWTIESNQSRGGFRYRKAMALQPEGRLLAVAPTDGTIRVVDRDTGRTEKIFVNPHGLVRALAWAPDGRTLAVASNDNTLAFWKAEQGQIQSTHQFEKLSDIAWSPDGKRLAIAADRLEMWDPKAKDLVPSQGTKPRCERVAWKPDGSQLAIHSKDQILLVDANSRKPIRPVFEMANLPAYLRPDIDFAWSPDGRHLASVSREAHHAHVWDSQEDAIRQIACPGNEANGNRFESILAWSPDGRLGLCFHQVKVSAHHAVVWNLETGEPGPWLGSHSQSGIECLEWSEDRQLLVMGTHHGRLLAYHPEKPDTPRWEQLRPAGAGRNTFLNAGKWSPDGRKLAYPLHNVNSDWSLPQLCVWDLATGTQRTGRQIEFRDIAWSGNGSLLLVADKGPTLAFESLSLLPASESEPNDAYAVEFFPDGKRYAVSVQGAVEIRELFGGKVIHRLPTEAMSSPRKIAVSKDGQWLALGDGRKLSLWNAQTGDPRNIGGESPLPGWPQSFSREGLLLVRHDGGFNIVDVPQAKIVRSLPVPKCFDAVWTADYQAVRTVDSEGVIRLWELDQFAPKEQIALPSGTLSRANFAPDGNLLITKSPGTYDKATFSLWNSETGHPVGTYVALIGGKHVFISPEGHYSESEGIEEELVYVVQTAEGQEALTPDEFSKRFGWKNNPDLAKPLLATPTTE